MRRLAAWVSCVLACTPAAAPSTSPDPHAPRASSVVPGEPTADRGALDVPQTPAEPPSSDRDLSGTWSGTYVYTTRGAGGAPGGATTVTFFAELQVDRDRVHGSVVEPNEFDHDAGTELRATIDGVIEQDGIVRLTKRYDGTGGVDHIVEYVGRLDLASTRIEGTWSTRTLSGRFAMKRDRPLPQVAMREYTQTH